MAAVMRLCFRLAVAAVAGFIDANGVTSFIDANGVTSFIDANGVVG